MNGLKRWMLLPLAIGLLHLSVATPALTQEKRVRTLTVAGDAQVQIPTTTTGVNVGIDVQGKDVNTVQAEVARRSSAVITLLRARKVQNLETTDISLEPIDDYRQGSQNQIVGFHATNSISFQVPNARVANLLGEAINAGANQINSLTFFSSDNVIEAAQKQAIREAFQNAEQKASAALSTMKATQQEIADVQINAPPPDAVARNFNHSDGRLAGEVILSRTPVFARSQTVRAVVTLTIRY